MLGGRHIIECFLRQRAESVIGFAAHDSAADHTRQDASGVSTRASSAATWSMSAISISAM